MLPQSILELNFKKENDTDVPSSGDYQFLRIDRMADWLRETFPSPHPGIINFFWFSIL